MTITATPETVVAESVVEAQASIPAPVERSPRVLPEEVLGGAAPLSLDDATTLPAGARLVIVDRHGHPASARGMLARLVSVDVPATLVRVAPLDEDDRPVEAVSPSGERCAFLDLLPHRLAPAPEDLTETAVALAITRAALDETRALIVDLRRDAEQARANRAEAEQSAQCARERHVADVRAIGAALKETADRREWCDQYDRAVEDLVERLSSLGAEALSESAIRTREWHVEVPVVATVCVPVTAASEDEAEQYARDMWRDYLDRYGLDLDLDDDRSLSVAEA